MKSREVLSHYSEIELCEIWDTLSNWEWDERIGEKPENFDELPNYNYKWYHKMMKRKTKADYIEPAIRRVSSLIPRKELFRYHHTHNLGRTNEEFEEWWKIEQIHQSLMS